MESTLRQSALVAAKITSKAKQVRALLVYPESRNGAHRNTVYWIVTALFCLQMSFTAYAQLRLPQVAEAFTHLGFPTYFRVELSWAELIGSLHCSTSIL
jgi:hypothetical protein